MKTVSNGSTKYGRLINVENDAKTKKGSSAGYLTAILYLAPGNLSGRELCPFRTPGCSCGCLYTAGRGRMRNVMAGRMRKSKLFLTDPRGFVDELARQIGTHVKRAARRKMRPVIRLNGTSDLPWENLRTSDGQSLMTLYPDVIFYDYTKNHARMLARRQPLNYHLTFSRSELNDADCLRVLANGDNVAVVFDTRKGAALPDTWNGYRVVDGDANDLRFLDPRGVVVGLRAKGDAKHDAHGFVVPCAA